MACECHSRPPSPAERASYATSGLPENNSTQGVDKHMASDDNAQPAARGGAKAEAAALARDLVRSAWKGTLSTVARSGGHPYGSLVALATTPDGAPLLLLSGLAEHMKNLAVEPRASVLVDGTSAGPAALTGPRVTLVGSIIEAEGEAARRRYLSRHPDAAGFIGFADFKLYALRIEWAHLVAGFGRIVRLDVGDVTVAIADAEAVVEAETSIIEHMNADHADAVALIAAHALGETPVSATGWRMIGCDPEGIDLADGARAARVRFPQCVMTPDDVRRALVVMVQAARASAAGESGNSVP